MQAWAFKLVISFVLRQLEKFQKGLDWAKVQASLDERVRALIPGKWFDDEACQIVDSALAVIKSVLAADDKIKHVLELLVDQKYEAAALYLKELVLGYLSKPRVYSALEVQLLDAVKAA